jgi:hypothetical protein
MKQTSIELLKQDLDAELKLGTKMVVNWDMYIKMHKQEIENSFVASRMADEFIPLISNGALKYENFEQYYQETFVSKGSDEVELPKQETLYTEKQVIAIVEKSRATGLTAEYIIQSLKKPKKD